MSDRLPSTFTDPLSSVDPEIARVLELELGRHVDIAINHDPDAIGMHEVNHPQTKHYIADVWEVCPIAATGGQAVGLLHAIVHQLAACDPVLVPVPDPQSPDACRARRLSAGFPALSSLSALPALTS